MTTITVEIRQHEGVFYATSKEVPGFFLCSKDLQTLNADVYPAMKQLLEIKEAHQKKSASRSAKPSNKAERLVERREFAFA
ncbi:MAG: hypothetical protein AB7R40_26440 [Nitrospiraceae bacterium]